LSTLLSPEQAPGRVLSMMHIECNVRGWGRGPCVSNLLEDPATDGR
jgi:hypothetical protein